MRTRCRWSAGRAVVLYALAAAVLLGAQASAWAHEDEDEPVPADTGDTLRPVYEIPPGADRIIGSPDPGPEPLHSGDRGGSLQFVTLGAVAAAVAFIMWRISRAARAARLRLSDTASESDRDQALRP